MHIERLLKDKHDDILRIARNNGAIEVKLFGSAARGQTSATSDIDVLVKMRPRSSLLDIIAIKQDLEDLLGLTVDVVTEDSISPYIKESILKEAVNL